MPAIDYTLAAIIAALLLYLVPAPYKPVRILLMAACGWAVIAAFAYVIRMAIR
jgi:hypothetical protein